MDKKTAIMAMDIILSSRKEYLLSERGKCELIYDISNADFEKLKSLKSDVIKYHTYYQDSSFESLLKLIENRISEIKEQEQAPEPNTCKHCENTFTPTDKRMQYCSQKCKKDAANLRQKLKG